MKLNIAQRLEQYTLKKPNELLLVEVEIEGEKDQIIIFKGFSSSLMGPTNFDPDIPVLPPTAKIIKIHRLASPYHPDRPNYIQQDLKWEDLEKLL
jgi:hypothetical protein